MKRILVLSPPEDRAGRAISLATDVAKRFGARVDVLRVLEEDHGTNALDQRTHGGATLREVLLEAETEALEASAARLIDVSPDVHIEVEWGVPWEAVVTRVAERGIEMVIKPAGGLSRNGSVFFGSTALHLFRRCPCPVWVVGESAGLPERIVAAVDPAAAPDRRRLAERVLHWAEQIAEWSDATIDVVSAWRGPELDWASRRVDAEETRRLNDAVRGNTDAMLDELLAGRRGPIRREQVHLLEGAPTEAIPAFAAQHSADMIVMGTLSRPDRIGDLMGATAETVIRQVRCSVLTVPPTASLDF